MKDHTYIYSRAHFNVIYSLVKNWLLYCGKINLEDINKNHKHTTENPYILYIWHLIIPFSSSPYHLNIRFSIDRQLQTDKIWSHFTLLLAANWNVKKE